MSQDAWTRYQRAGCGHVALLLARNRPMGLGCNCARPKPCAAGRGDKARVGWGLGSWGAQQGANLGVLIKIYKFFSNILLMF